MKREKLLAATFLLVLMTMAAAPLAVAHDEEGTGKETEIVKFAGNVQSYGETPAYGWMLTIAKVNETAKSGAFYSLENYTEPPLPPINNTYTYTFYLAILVNSSIVQSNYSGYDFYIQGLWSAYEVTWTFYDMPLNYSWSITPIVENVTGELTVTGNWTLFAIQIYSMDTISGTIISHFHHYCGIDCGMELPEVDVKCDREINVLDLIPVAKACGSVPGMQEFNFTLDLNFDLQINVLDLIEISKHLGEQY